MHEPLSWPPARSTESAWNGTQRALSQAVGFRKDKMIPLPFPHTCHQNLRICSIVLHAGNNLEHLAANSLGRNSPHFSFDLTAWTAFTEVVFDKHKLHQVGLQSLLFLECRGGCCLCTHM